MNSTPISAVEIQFNTAEIIPPPYSHCYSMRIDDLGSSSPMVRFVLHYTQREDLTVEEILDEGFSENDDFEWAGELHSAWGETITATLQKTKLTTKPLKAESNEVQITIHTPDAPEQVGIPANTQEWEYLGQELIQAIFETANIEAPLRLIYLKRSPKGQQVQLEMNVFFSRRTVKASMQMGQLKKSRQLDWQTLNPMLKLIYSGEFLAEKALSKEPHSPGKYLSLGDGLWYEFGSSLQNPNGNNRYLSDVENTLDNLLPEQ